MFHKTQRSKIVLSKDNAYQIEQVFREADEGGKKYLNYEDIKVAIMALFGYKPQKEEVRQILKSFGHVVSVDSGGYWGIDLIHHLRLGMELDADTVKAVKGLTQEQFEEAMAPKFAAVDEDEEIRNAFTAFDVNCRGFLTLDDAKKIFSQVCPRLPEHRIELAFREMDRDGDGRVSYKDFDFMMKFNNFS